MLERRAARRYDPETLALGGKLLELHPEVYTVWNHRREALQPVLAAGGDAAVTAVQQASGACAMWARGGSGAEGA